MADDSRFDRASGAPLSWRRAQQRDESDAVLRKLIGMDPSAFLKLIGVSGTGPIEFIEPGIFPHVLPVDKVLRIAAPEPWIAVVGLATSLDPALVGWIETTLLCLPYGLPIEAIIVLVRPEADDPNVTGERMNRMPWGQVASRFTYQVIRVWQQPAGRPLGDLSPRLLARLKASGLPELISELRECAAASAENAPSESVMCLVFALPEQGRVDSKLLAEVAELERLAPCVYLALGRHREHQIVSSDEGCTVMRWKLYQRGARRFGPPDERVASTIGEISSPRRLTALDQYMARIDRLNIPIASWDELLAWREPAGGSSGSLPP